MQIAEKEKLVVSLSYELRVDDESGNRVLTDKSEEGHPLTFLYGSGELLPVFEEHLKGMQVGENFSFTIAAEDGYGEYDEDEVHSLPIETFRINGELDYQMLQEGNVLPMSDDMGNRLDGRILEVLPDNIVMDFNHPLAGFDLHFSGTIVNLRKATLEELSHGHAHGPDGHHHH
jgi:FKBP-type peptidyl-prolyl cis-trans isomerase SlyD